MAATEQAKTPYSEPRWPVALTIVVALFLLAAIPGRIRLFPAWVPIAAMILVLCPMVAVGLTHARPRWLLLERVITLLFVVLTGVAMIKILAFLVHAMMLRPIELSGLQLLSSSIAVWVSVVLVFSLLYWQIDRGGPGARADRPTARPDWLFPQVGFPQEAPPDWRPTFVDYLFLSYSTATSFSTAEVVPMTTRAKLLMMLQSSISLVTIVLVASRAINILGN